MNRLLESKEVSKSSQLSELKPGDSFIFGDTTLRYALKNAKVYMVIGFDNKDKLYMTNITTGHVLTRDTQSSTLVNRVNIDMTVTIDPVNGGS